MNQGPEADTLASFKTMAEACAFIVERAGRSGVPDARARLEGGRNRAGRVHVRLACRLGNQGLQERQATVKQQKTAIRAHRDRKELVR